MLSCPGCPLAGVPTFYSGDISNLKIMEVRRKIRSWLWTRIIWKSFFAVLFWACTIADAEVICQFVSVYKMQLSR